MGCLGDALNIVSNRKHHVVTEMKYILMKRNMIAKSIDILI